MNGEDIIDIVVAQPATGRFIAEKLYNFFVSDDPAPEEAIETLAAAYFDSNYNINEVMRALLLSDFFQQTTFAKVKSPAEVVASILRLVGDFQEPRPGLQETTYESKYMGQELLNPLRWKAGIAVKNGLTAVLWSARVNFSSDQVGTWPNPGYGAS